MKQVAGAVAAVVMMAAMGTGCGARREEAKAPSAPSAPPSDARAPSDASTGPAPTACAPRRAAGAPPLWWEEPEGMPADGRKEVDASVPAIAAAIERYYGEHGAFPAGQLAITPKDSCCRQDFGARGMCAPSATAFDAELWCALGFRPRGAHYFQYALIATPTTATAIATGDLDCDGTSITYVITASVLDGVPRVQIVGPAPDTD